MSRSKSPPVALPIDGKIPEILRLWRANRCLVLEASPGAGKTTRVPPAFWRSLQSDGLTESEVAVLEPRRLAAQLSATRVAEELGESVGGVVGYQFRAESVVSSATRVRYLTEGLLLRRMLGDPLLRGTHTVVLDEFHERHLHGDLALALLKKLQSGPRPELKIVVMSATLETERIAQYLASPDGAPAPIVRITAPRFDVETRYRPSAKHLEKQVRDAVEEVLDDVTSDAAQGDILVFLPGMADIRRCEQELTEMCRRTGVELHVLHGESSREEQGAAVSESRARRVILATNVAETSLTIPGVSVVIDSGLARVASYSFWSGLPALRTRPISRASAVQRAGRAGRTGPGVCVRLYSKGEFEGRAPFETPEIQRADLSQAYLEIVSMETGERLEPESLPWLERPSQAAFGSARDLLTALGAMSSGVVTPLGREMAQIPAHPRLSRVLAEARSRGVFESAARLAAAISEGKVENGELAGQLRALSADRSLDRWVERWSRILRPGKSAGRDPRVPREAGDGPDTERALRCSFLAGFADRVGKFRARGELLMASGGMAALDGESGYVIAIDAQERKRMGEARSRLFVEAHFELEEEDLLELDPSPWKDETVLEYESAGRKIVERTRSKWFALTLEESSKDYVAGDSARDLEAAKLLAEQLCLLDGYRWDQVRERLARYHFAQSQGLDLGLPADLEHQDAAWWRTQVAKGCVGYSALREVEGLRVEDLIGSQSADLERIAPEYVTVGQALGRPRRAKIYYEWKQPPWTESRLQDFFGMREGPRVGAQGRVALTLHLLAPNHRAVQVTSDLAGFWAREYPRLRKELGRRYPRHAWPEDPMKPS